MTRAKIWTAATLMSIALTVQGGEPEELRLYAIDCGQMLMNGVHASNPCFLIRHPKADLLWDTGLPQSLADTPGGVSKIGQAEVTIKRKLTDSLAMLDLEPADIEFFAMSHTHFDHVGNARLFAQSTWIVDAKEHAWAFGPLARISRGFAAYRELEQFRTRRIEGDADFDVFGDGSVTIIQAPGHTPGHTVLLLRLPRTGAVLLAGDLWNTAESRKAQRGTDQEIATMKRIEARIATHRARVIRQHVMVDFAALPKFPDFLE